jgi:hypothetical protein
MKKNEPRILRPPMGETPNELMARAEGHAKQMGMDEAVFYGAALMRAGMRMSGQPDASAVFEGADGQRVVALCVVLTETSAPILKQVDAIFRMLDTFEASADSKLKGIKALLDATTERTKH